ncbi:hypothetical protein ACTPEV_04220, partial [Clostridioides difficile]
MFILKLSVTNLVNVENKFALNIVDESKIDIILGGSQKAISAPAGLTIVGISQDAKNCIKNR